MQINSTPVPNVYFDQYLKKLKSAELKILLIVIRQTLGWHDRFSFNGRKETDWISGSQLKTKTGCSSRAITTAINTLVNRKFVDVLDERMNLLDTPEKRKGRQRLLFRLNRNVYKHEEKPVETYSTSAIFAEDFSKKVMNLTQKMRITKETIQN